MLMNVIIIIISLFNLGMEISVCRDLVLVIDVVNIFVLFDSQLSLTFKCSFTDVIAMPFLYNQITFSVTVHHRFYFPPHFFDISLLSQSQIFQFTPRFLASCTVFESDLELVTYFHRPTVIAVLFFETVIHLFLLEFYQIIC